MNEHTPGPWTLGSLIQNDGSVAILAGDVRIARVDNGLRASPEIARLIAKAPELAALLRDMVQSYDESFAKLFPYTKARALGRGTPARILKARALLQEIDG